MSTCPSVSIVVPVCNVERYLDQCIDSIKAQTLDDIEIICVNDGSKDSSLEILRRHAASDDRIRVIDKPNAGYGHTINRGIEAARGVYIGIVESDDFIEPDMFETLYACAEKDHLDIARSNYWLYWSTPEERNDLMECYFPDRCDKVFNPRELTEVFFFPPALWSMLVRRDLIVNNGLKLLETPGAAFQDTSFSFKLWACAERAELIHRPLLHYRQDNEGSSINNKSKAFFVCEEYAEVERFIREDLKDESLYPLAEKRKFDAYSWNLERIDPSLREEFAQRAAGEFSTARDQGHLNKNLFSDHQWALLELLVSAPDVYVARLNAGSLDDEPKRGVFASLFSAIRR